MHQRGLKRTQQQLLQLPQPLQLPLQQQQLPSPSAASSSLLQCLLRRLHQRWGRAQAAELLERQAQAQAQAQAWAQEQVQVQAQAQAQRRRTAAGQPSQCP